METTTINATIEGAMILSRTKQDAQILVNVANDMKILLVSFVVRALVLFS
jgi:hypothetical protein